MAERQASRLEMIGQIRTRLKQVIRGKDEVIDLLLNAVLANGHVLLDDVPGVGKTTLAKALALAVKADFKRIQFTSDMMPSDILAPRSSTSSPANSSFIPARSSRTSSSATRSTARRLARSRRCWRP